MNLQTVVISPISPVSDGRIRERTQNPAHLVTVSGGLSADILCKGLTAPRTALAIPPLRHTSGLGSLREQPEKEAGFTSSEPHGSAQTALVGSVAPCTGSRPASPAALPSAEGRRTDGEPACQHSGAPNYQTNASKLKRAGSHRVVFATLPFNASVPGGKAGCPKHALAMSGSLISRSTKCQF